MELDLFGEEVQAILDKPESVTEKYIKKQKSNAKPKTKTKVPDISSLNSDIRAEYEKNIRTTYTDIKGEEFDTDIMRDDLRNFIFCEDNEGNRYRERIWDKIKEFGVVKWFEAKGYPTEASSVWCNRYTGSEITLGEEVERHNSAIRKENTLEQQGYLLWENNCPKEIFDKCELTETTKIIELKKLRAELRSPYEPNLNKWKEVIVDYCKEKNQEIEHIWFDTSVPYDCELVVRMKGHEGCYYSCVSFRFQDNKFKAWDSNFNGGTTFVDNGFADSNRDISEKEEILKIMDRVFEKECEASGWGEDEQKKILIDSEGWVGK